MPRPPPHLRNQTHFNTDTRQPNHRRNKLRQYPEQTVATWLRQVQLIPWKVRFNKRQVPQKVPYSVQKQAVVGCTGRGQADLAEDRIQELDPPEGNYPPAHEATERSEAIPRNPEPHSMSPIIYVM